MSRHEHNMGRKRARRLRAHEPADRQRVPFTVERAPTREHAARSWLPESSLREQPAIQAFAHNVRIMRTRGQLSASELAARSGIRQGVLRRIEEGRVDPPYSLILCLAEALETSPTYLITQPILQDAITPKLRPPPPGTPRLKARATWEAIREDIRALYAAGEHHRIIALELGLTRMQLQSQLHHLFREGMPKR
jgi:transcriptional regulator with XRE-family HTH domain